MDIKKAESMINQFKDLIGPVAKDIIEARKIMVIREAFRLEREAREANKRFMVVPKEQYDDISAALHPNLFSNLKIVDLGFDHILIRGTVCFEDGPDVPKPEDLPPLPYKYVKENGCLRKVKIGV